MRQQICFCFFLFEAVEPLVIFLLELIKLFLEACLIICALYTIYICRLKSNQLYVEFSVSRSEAYIVCTIYLYEYRVAAAMQNVYARK